jgi:transcriptional regulator with XRE-family HTH domain
MSDTPDLASAIGQRLRALRDEHGVTADTLAMQARRLGLGWQRSTVGTIEAGRRRLTGEELLLLPLLLSMALPVTVTLRDLLDRDIALTDELVMTPNGFRQLLDERAAVYGGYRLTSQRPAAAAGNDPQSSVELWRRIERLWPDVHAGSRLDLARLRAVERAAGGEAEQKAARTLDCSALDVSALAHRLWGRGLTEERDRRVHESGHDMDTPAAVRVRRGHVTRLLVDELTPLVTEHLHLLDASRPPPADG